LSGLKRDVVFLDGSLGSGRATAAESATRVTTTRRLTTLGILRALGVFLVTNRVPSSSTAAWTGPEELEALADHTQLAALLTGGLVLPAVELKTTLDVDRAALLAVLASDLCLTPPKRHVNVGGLLALLSTLGGVNAIHGDPEVGNSTSLGSVLDLRVTGDIPDDHHFVEVSHKRGG